MPELTPQELKARADLLLARGKAIQDAGNAHSRGFQEAMKYQEQRHKKWVQRRNQLRDPAYREEQIADMRRDYEEKQRREEQEALIAVKSAEYADKLRAKGR